MSVKKTDIIRYEVREELQPVDPMYGKTKLIYGEDALKDADTAIEKAKEYQRKHPGAIIYAIANQYTCERNVAKHFVFETHYLWHEYLTEAQIIVTRKRLGV